MGVLARFELHLRCQSCLAESVHALDVPNIEGAPQNAAELCESGLLDRVAFSCAGCESEAASLTAVSTLKPTRPQQDELDRPMAATNKITIYSVIGYSRDKRGRLVAEQPSQAQNEGAARRRAQRYADAGGGAIATSQTGDPQMGDWDEPVLLVKCGELPEAVESELAA